MTLLYTFLDGADEYKVYTDPVAGVIRVTLNDDIITSGSPFTSATTGFEDGDYIKKTCSGTTLYEATALLIFPYAAIQSTANSAFCGYVAPVTDCSGLSTTVSITDAINNTPSGKLVVNVSPAGYYQFSLNNVVWQGANVFNFLFPGAYNIYVKSYDGVCTDSTTATVGMDVVEIAPIDVIPYADARNICYFFRLIDINNIVTTIREPLKWDAVQIIGERDPTFHGYKWKYTDGNTTLGFDCDSGKTIVEDCYNTYGNDGVLKLEYGYTYQNKEYILFKGILDFNSYKWYGDRVECAVLVDDFDTTLYARQDTKVSMTQANTYDDGVITPPAPYNLLFHAKEILTQLQIQNDNISLNYLAQQSSDFYILPDTTEPTVTDIQETFPYPLNVEIDSPETLDLYDIKFGTGGFTDGNIAWTLTGTVTAILGIWAAEMRFVHKQYNSNGTYTTFTDVLYSGTVTTGVPFTIIGSKVITNFYFGVNDKIFLYINLNGVARPAAFDITQTLLTYNLDHRELTADTYGDVWFIDDAIRQTLGVISDNKYAFRSTLLERKNAVQLTDGCASKNALTNGFQIRNFEAAEKPLYIDFNTILNSINSELCIGSNYATINNVPTLRIERRDFFYQDRQIIAIDPGEDYITGIADYYEETAKDIIYNEIEIGYKKYQSEGVNTLDEFNTYQDRLTPIKTNAKKLEIKSDFIRSGYSIEDIRREQFAESPSDSVSNDDECFAVALHGDSDTIFTAEKDELFSTVNNLISPETSYNLRYSPARMLYNWFVWLKGIFTYKLTTETIKTTFIAQNGDLETQLSFADTCPLGDLDYALIQEKADIPLSALDTTGNIYTPEWAYVTCRITPDKIQIMNEALSGRYGSTKDYGYIMVKKPTGEWQAGWVYNLTYEYGKEKATIKMLKSYYTPSVITEDCCEWLEANGCYVIANGKRLIA